MEIASLWFDVDATAVTPPTVSREQILPLSTLSWENFERLCFRLAHRGGEVEDARMYGERGQAQEGIDLYVRCTTEDYTTWQCKRYQTITASDIKNAVTKFLSGDWASRTKTFRLAVAPSLNATGLAEEIERQRTRCNSANITFEPLDQSHLSLMLKDHPDLVDDFFGRSWVENFNGPDAAASLSQRKLNREQKLNARRFIQTLYVTHFRTVDGGIPSASTAFSGAVPPLMVFDRYVEPAIELVESILELEQASSTQSESGVQDVAQRRSAKRFCKREIRTKLSLFTGLADKDLFLLLGSAGFGKSAALRVIIHSLLDGSGRFPSLAKAWGQRLPLLLPFGFLTRHFIENELPTVEGALKAWLMVLGAKNDVLKLLEEVIGDERLLLLVDGLDEWQNREAAVTALTALTTYAQTRQLPLVATSRPLGFEQISDFGPDWKRANLLPLSLNQQQDFAGYWFRHFHKAEAALDTTALEQAVTRDVIGFTRDLSEDSTLSELGGIPLLLSAMIYLKLTGRVLPRSRLAVLEELIRALLEDQPRRRAQAAMQRGDRSILRSRRIRFGIEYLAYRIHQEPNSIALSNTNAMQLLDEYFRTNLGLPASEADEWATHVLEIGRHEFGILVAPQENHIGLLHRIFQEYLAAKHLARLPLDQVKLFCAKKGLKVPWHDVTLILLQLLERQDEVDSLIDELRKPAVNYLEEPFQQIILTCVAVAEINCSRGKAHELLTQVFSWIECGRWMPLRRSLVQEIATGLESEQVGVLISNRISRWFPGRVEWLHDIPSAAVKQPTPETVSDLLIALHNCGSSYEYRSIAEALATFAQKSPDLADELIRVIKGPADPELMGAALHALARGWPSHTALSSLLQAASAAPAEELRYVAILARFHQGERSNEIRDALVGFCRDDKWLWPWDKDIVKALVTGWPQDPKLMSEALKSITGFGYPNYWASKTATEYLLHGCPGNDTVAQTLADKLMKDEDDYSKLDIMEVHEALLSGFTKHPLLVPAAEAWLEKNAATHHSPLDIAVIAKLGGTQKCRQALLDWLRQGRSTPAWIISTLLEMSECDEPETHAVLLDYISDEQRLSRAARWLPAIVSDPQELGIMLRKILSEAHVFDSCSALEILVDKEGLDAPDLWPMVEARLINDEEGHYWRLGHHTLVKIWPDQPLIRRLVKSTLYNKDISISALYQVYGSDPEIRPLLDKTMYGLHRDLRVEFARAIEPLARRGVPAAVTLAAEYKNEPDGEARTIAARAYARARIREGGSVQDLIDKLAADLTDFLIGSDQRKQAAAVALLELGRADLLVQQRRDNQPIKFTTHLHASHNWEFVSTVVEHWEQLTETLPNIWELFNHSPIIATELAKAGKGAHALSQTAVFENAVCTEKQLQIDQVRALITLRGRSELLRDLFLDRLKYMEKHKSMMVLERGAYAAIASYLVDNFRGDEAVGQVMFPLSTSSLIRDVVFIALCQGWPDAPPVVAAAEKLPTLIDGPEPRTAWLFASKADVVLMAKYLMNYPTKLIQGYNGEARDGIIAVQERLQNDEECRNLVFANLHNITELNTQIALTKLLAPSMRKNSEFHKWISEQLHRTRDNSFITCELTFDVISNACKPVEFALLEAALTQK
ncbi:MAG: NACHT domain-containing protein [Desulfobulbaceae bacterium]|nr:NACHT domain-containing protein [Desulfobulbaceae bacterium]